MDFLFDERVKPVILIVVLTICYVIVHQFFIKAATPDSQKEKKE